MSTVASIEKFGSTDSEIKSPAIRIEALLPVYVIYTSMNGTLKALEKAGQLAQHLNSGIEMLAVQTVAYALPLDMPFVSSDFLARRLEAMTARFSNPIRISTYLCRDPVVALKRILKRNCQVVMAIRKKRWWPNRDERLARKLRRAGFDVALVETE
jgi:hypothetical protein